MWKFGSKIYLSTITFTAKDNVRGLIVGKVFSGEALAYYNQGQKYPNLLVTDVVESIGKVLFPVFSNQQDDRKLIKRELRDSVNLSSFLLLPCILGLVAIADSFILLLLTDKWAPCIPFLRILCFVYITRPMSTIFQKAILAIGKSDINLIHEIITSGLTVVLLLLSVFWLHSIELIAWSYVLISIIGTVFLAIFINIYYDYSVKQICEDYLPSLVIASIMALIVYYLGKIQCTLPIKFFIQLFGGIIIYLILTTLFNNKVMQYLKSVFVKKIDSIE